MEFLRKYKGICLLVGVLLLIAGGWLLFWHRIGEQLDQAGYDAAFNEIQYEDTYYTRCDEDVLAEYLSGYVSGTALESLCGEQLGTVSIVTGQGIAERPVFRCKPLADAGLQDAIIMMPYEDTYYTYELSGFTALDDMPSIGAVCEAYGITSAAEIASVAVYDADGSLLDTMTEEAALSSFYAKLADLGDCLDNEETVNLYYAAYVAEYGESDAVSITDGEVEFADADTEEQAMTLWSTGLCLVNIRLKNGLQLRNTLYMPAAGMYAVYGTYALTVPFFS